jgi:hypothetical protein
LPYSFCMVWQGHSCCSSKHVIDLIRRILDTRTSVTSSTA